MSIVDSSVISSELVIWILLNFHLKYQTVENDNQTKNLTLTIFEMGLFDKLAGILKIRKEQINILVVGLNNSGKSTIVNHFKAPEERAPITVPTVGFSVEKFQSE